MIDEAPVYAHHFRDTQVRRRRALLARRRHDRGATSTRTWTSAASRRSSTSTTSTGRSTRSGTTTRRRRRSSTSTTGGSRRWSTRSCARAWSSRARACGARSSRTACASRRRPCVEDSIVFAGATVGRDARAAPRDRRQVDPGPARRAHRLRPRGGPPPLHGQRSPASCVVTGGTATKNAPAWLTVGEGPGDDAAQRYRSRSRADRSPARDPRAPLVLASERQAAAEPMMRPSSRGSAPRAQQRARADRSRPKDRPSPSSRRATGWNRCGGPARFARQVLALAPRGARPRRRRAGSR